MNCYIPDYYVIPGVRPTANEAWRARAKATHPDRLRRVVLEDAVGEPVGDERSARGPGWAGYR